MKRIITDFEDINLSGEEISYKMNWLHNICKLPVYETGNYQIYADVYLDDMKVKNSSILESKGKEHIQEGQKMMFLICENDRAVLGLMYCGCQEDKERYEEVCSSYLQGFPVIPFHQFDFRRYKVCFPPILEEVEKILKEDAESPKKKEFIFKTFKIDADGKNAMDYVKAHMLTLSRLENTKKSAPQYVYFPSRYGVESGVVMMYSAKNKYHEIRITERGLREMQKNLLYQQGIINIEEDFADAHPEIIIQNRKLQK